MNIGSSLVVAVLTGGISSEREVSFSTCKTVTASLERLGIAYHVFDLQDKDWLVKVKETNPRLALLAIHGSFGEGGDLQEILESEGIPYTGSLSKTAKLAFNKRLTKNALAGTGISMPREMQKSNITLPAVIKPNCEGSSVGVSIVKDPARIKEALEKAEACGSDILIEEFIEGRELSCAVTDVFGKVQALPIVEIKPKNSFFDYEAKYREGMSEEICPALLDPAIAEKVLKLSELAFTTLGIRQYCRLDLILKGDEPYFLEVNTIPGMTSTSLINKEIKAAGLEFDDFIAKLIETSL